jgi:hypothetical protein
LKHNINKTKKTLVNQESSMHYFHGICIQYTAAAEKCCNLLVLNLS